MEKPKHIGEDKQLQYQYAGVITFELLFKGVLQLMPAEGERIRFITHFMEDLQEWVNYDNPDMESAEVTSNALKMDWDAGMFLCYIDNYGSPEFRHLVDDDDVNLSMMGFVSGIHTVIDSLQDLLRILGEGKELDSLYVIENIKNGDLSFLNTNVEDLKHKRSLEYNDLIKSYNLKLASSFTDKELFVETEIKELNRLFITGQSSFGWEYLSDTLNMSPKEIDAIYQERNAVINGTYVSTFYSLDTEKRLNYAKLLAVRDYINYIKDDNGTSSENNKRGTVGNKNNILFKLVLNTKDINVDTLKMNLTKSHKLLKDSGFIDGDLKDYRSIFWPGEPLSRKVTWLGDRNELKYLICKLSGEEFRDSPIGKEARITLEKTGKSVFWSNDEIFKKAANSFLNKEKGDGVIPLGGVAKPRLRTYLQDHRREALDKVAAYFTVK